MKIDLLEFARQGRDADGELAVASLARVETPDPSGALHWTARGSLVGRDRTPRVELAVDGTIVLVCQRCLGPMRQPIAIATTFVVANDEVAAAALDDDDAFDVLAHAPDFDLDVLVEDEVLLALPSSPRHAVCPPGPADRAVQPARPSPFAALAALRTRDDGGSER